MAFIFEEQCLYFSELTATVHYDFIAEPLSFEHTDTFLQLGWRHFGNTFFCNCCRDCHRCMPIRVLVQLFSPSKSQRRVLKKNKKTIFKMISADEFLDKYLYEGFNIYKQFNMQRYKKNSGFENINDFVSGFIISPTQTKVSCVFNGDKLIGNGFLDIGKNAISTIYFSFDPAFSDLSLGTYSILKEIEWAKNHQYQFYYLGYYIKDLSSMAYKANFKPYQLYDFNNKVWYEPND